VSSRAIGVHIDLDGTPRRIGTLWAHLNKGRESASFAYDGMFKSSVLCATNDFGQIICFEPVKGILAPAEPIFTEGDLQDGYAHSLPSAQGGGLSWHWARGR
jgi:hypothetical protein